MTKRNPLDDLLTDEELLKESRKTAMRSTPSKGRVQRHILRTIPVSVFVLFVLSLISMGVVIGVHVSQRVEPVAQTTYDQTEVAQPLEVSPSKEAVRTPTEHQPDSPETFAKSDSGEPDRDKNLAEVRGTRTEQRRAFKIPDAPPHKPQERPLLKPQELFAEASPSVVVVKLFDVRGQSLKQGSGFFVRDDSTVVTNYHVIEWSHSAIVMLQDGTHLPVLGVEGFDQSSDLAILKVAHDAAKEIRPLPLESIKLPPDGSRVYVIGSPHGLEDTKTSGIVSNNNRERVGRNWIQIDAAISPGSSGSPVLNDQGNVIGVATWSYEGRGFQNLNFASPVSVLAFLLLENPKFQRLPDLLGTTKRNAFNPVRTLLDKGTAKARDAAAEILDRLSTASQQFSEYWVLTGDICQKRGEFGAAIDAFNNAVAIDAEDSTTWYRIGLVYDLLQLNDEALKAYRRGRDVNPKDENCWRGMGCRLLAAGRLTDAKAALLRSVELNPKLAKSHAALGDVLVELGDNKGGVAAYKAATGIEPNDWLLWFSYGNLLQGIGQYREAVAAFEKARLLAKDPVDRELCEEELRTSRRLIR